MRKTRMNWGKVFRFMAKTAMAFAFAVVILAMTNALEASAANTGKVTASAAKVRESASTSSEAIASVTKGDTVSIVGQVTGDDGKIWYEIHVNADTKGYVRSDLVQVDGTVSNTGSTSSSADVTKLNPVSAKVTGNQVNVRKSADAKSDKITSVDKGTVLTIVGKVTGTDKKVWYKVEFVSNNKDVTGFIRSDFVDVQGELTPYQEPSSEPDVEDEPVVTPPPAQNDPEPEVPVSKKYETTEIDGKWYLTNNDTGENYRLEELIKLSADNAEKLKEAEKDMKSQKGAIIVLVIILVLVIAVVALAVVRFKDLIMDELTGMKGSPVPQRPANRKPLPPASHRPRPTMQGQRPAGAPQGRPVAPQGQRPAGAPQGRPVAPQGQRPAGAPQGRPVAPQGQRPVAPQGQRPVAPQGQRPVAPQGQRPVAPQPQKPAADEDGPSLSGINTAFDMTATPAADVAEVTKKSVEEQAIQKNVAEDTSAKKAKNFMSEDDEFEFEFLNMEEDNK